MISYSNFRRLLSQHILVPCGIETQGFIPLDSTKIDDFSHYLSSNSASLDLMPYPEIYGKSHIPFGRCIFWHEEPLNNLDKLNELGLHLTTAVNINTIVLRDYPSDFITIGIYNTNDTPDINIHILANSEKSPYKKKWLKENNVLDWYFFFHGFAALDWFRDFKYFDHTNVNIMNKFEKSFVCLNHLLSDSRSYRLYLLANIFSKKLEKHSYISAGTLTQELLKKEIFSSKKYLSKQAKKHVYQNLNMIKTPLVLDKIDYNIASADISTFAFKALWFLVTETVFFEDKLHLTEKIFKPIVMKRPFILCSTPGSLQYLRSYGFKTFDRWIDESYDTENDPEKRMDMITHELEKLCHLNSYDLMEMYKEMLPILDYNYNYFFNDFKVKIIDELLDNFEICLKQYNLGRYADRFIFPENLFNKSKCRKILMS